jgi:UDP-N-acetyl-D-galactosamine dehydrogenase
MTFPNLHTCTVAVIGLGYVGLPLAVEFAIPQNCLLSGLPLQRRVIGYDINESRLLELQDGYDRTNETTNQQLQDATLLEFSRDPAVLAEADVYIITVPTPIDRAKQPNLTPLQRASHTVAEAMRSRRQREPHIQPLVIYESTVYPGATKEVCVPILEEFSGLVFNKDFYCAYSPERINPGDHHHRLKTIIKVTSGSTPETADWIDAFYGSIISAGTHKAASIEVAEAAKVIENTQRDLNIALVNELAILFHKLGIDTLDVLNAAGTKWNFLPFRPGLVGGHCIGVDPYYLTHKAEKIGYHPQIVLAGRRINDGMVNWVVEQLILAMASRSIVIAGAKVLILGLTFKENCPDIRNTKVVDLIQLMSTYGIIPVVVDPWVNPNEAEREYGLSVHLSIPEKVRFSAVVVAVAHHQFTNLDEEDWQRLVESDGVLLDLKGLVPRSIKPIRL